MIIEVYPRHSLEMKWAVNRNLYTPDAKSPPLCLRCGSPMNGRLAENALSRHCDVMICCRCGRDEALRDFSGNVLPLTEWYVVKQGFVQPVQPEGGAVLRKDCVFQHIFDGPKKTTPLNSWPIPECKVLHSRADYDGRKWWRTWHPCHSEPLGDQLCDEIDDFADSLMDLPAFKNLTSLRNFCLENAASTDDPTEYNMYSESEHFYIWLRMITREKDYNLYGNFYAK